MIKHYFNSLFNEDLTFILGWEAFVFFMLLMFISIIIRLKKIDNMYTELIEEIQEL